MQPPTSRGAPPRSSARLAAAAALALLTALVFLPVLRFGFLVLDDRAYVLENPQVNQGLTPEGLRWAVTSAGYAANWHPLTWLSHQVDVSLFGLAPAGHHATSLLLHAVAAGVLFLALARLTGAAWRAWLVAALFALHPLRVESVAWIAERKDPLSGLLFLLTVALWVRHLRRPAPSRYGAVVAAFALALAAKPMVVTLPLVLLLLDWWPLGRIPRDGRRGAALCTLVVEKLPLLLLAAASAAPTLLAQRRGGAVVALFEHPLPARAANALVSVAAYLGSALWPTRLAIWYPLPDAGHPAGVVAGAALLVVAVTAIALWLRRRRPALIVGWCWYLVMLLPVSGLVQVGAQARADRYTYLPMIGVALALAWLAPAVRAAGARLALAAVASCALLALGLATRAQLGHWRDDETLLRHALSVAGESWMVRNALGHALLRDGRDDDAADAFRAALTLSPDPETSVALGTALARQGRHTEALAQYDAALRVAPLDRTARFNRGAALEALGRDAEAEREYREALGAGLAQAGSYGNLGNLLARQGRADEAAAAYRAGVGAFPDSAELWNNLGVLEAGRGDIAAAAEAFAQAVRLNPDWQTARDNLDRANRALAR